MGGKGCRKSFVNILHVHQSLIAQGIKLCLRRVAWGVLALGSVWEFSTRAKHMAVGIHRACRQFEGGFGRAGVPVQPARGLGEFHRFFPFNRV